VPKNAPYKLIAIVNGEKALLSKLIDVPVEQNTGVDSRTEQYKEIENPDVIRRAPFRIFEVIKPADRDMFIGNGNFQAFRFTLFKKWKTSGKTDIKFILTVENETENGMFSPTIHSIEIPSAAESE